MTGRQSYLVVSTLQDPRDLFTFVILAHQVSTARAVDARAADATDALEAGGGLCPMASRDSARKNPVAGKWQVIQAGERFGERVRELRSQ